MCGLPKAPKPARFRNLPRARHNVTRSRRRLRQLLRPSVQQQPHRPRLRHRHPLLRRLCRRQSLSLRHLRNRMRSVLRIPTTQFRRNRSLIQKQFLPRKLGQKSPVARRSENGFRRFRCLVMWSITAGTKPVASPRPPSGPFRFAIGLAFPLAVRPARDGEDIRRVGSPGSPYLGRSAS